MADCKVCGTGDCEIKIDGWDIFDSFLYECGIIIDELDPRIVAKAKNNLIENIDSIVDADIYDNLAQEVRP